MLELPQALARVTSKPAAIFRLPAGRLAAGEIADIIVIDNQCHYQCDADKFISAGKNCALGGWDFSARVETTLVAGKIID